MNKHMTIVILEAKLCHAVSIAEKCIYSSVGEENGSIRNCFNFLYNFIDRKLIGIGFIRITTSQEKYLIIVRGTQQPRKCFALTVR